MKNENITQLVNGFTNGSKSPNHIVSDAIYKELYKIARAHRRKWSGNDTLNTTSLIHEAYLKLTPFEGAYKNRTHFFASASKIMRQVLVNYAQHCNADKRVPSEQDLQALSENQEVSVDELIFIDKLLQKIEEKNERHCRIVECRIFGGMSIQETATALGISPATVKREWALLSAWLYRELNHSAEPIRSVSF